jgi:hypothetical protein
MINIDQTIAFKNLTKENFSQILEQKFRYNREIMDSKFIKILTFI